MSSARRATRDFVDLTLADPQAAGLSVSCDAVRAALADLRALCEPSDPRGILDAREALAARLEVAPEHVVLTSGLRDAYRRVLSALAEPGEEVLVPSPRDRSLDPLADECRIALATYDAGEPAQAWEAIGERTRAIVVADPIVPTGVAVDRADLEALAALELPLIVAGAAAPIEGATYQLGAAHLFPALRIGWVAVRGPHEADAVARLAAHVPPAIPSQYALPAALASAEALEAAIAARTAINRKALDARMPSVDRPGAKRDAWWAAIPLSGIDDDEAFAAALRREHAVHVHAGADFDFPHGAWLVVSLLPPPDAFERGLAAILAQLG